MIFSSLSKRTLTVILQPTLPVWVRERLQITPSNRCGEYENKNSQYGGIRNIGLFPFHEDFASTYYMKGSRVNSNVLIVGELTDICTQLESGKNYDFWHEKNARWKTGYLCTSILHLKIVLLKFLSLGKLLQFLQLSTAIFHHLYQLKNHFLQLPEVQPHSLTFLPPFSCDLIASFFSVLANSSRLKDVQLWDLISSWRHELFEFSWVWLR